MRSFTIMMLVVFWGCNDVEVIGHGSGEALPEIDGVMRIAVVAEDGDGLEMVKDQVVRCGGDVVVEVSKIFVVAVRVRHSCVAKIAAIEGVFLELDLPIIVQGTMMEIASTASTPLPERVPFGAYRIGMDVVWGEGYFGTGARIAIVDTGIDCGHPEFGGRITKGFDAQTGAVNDPDAVMPSFCVDENGHGTMVAGLLVSAHDGVGTMGEVPESEIFSVKALGEDGLGLFSEIAAGVVWAVDMARADVVLLAFGGLYDSAAVMAATAYARERGVVVIAAVGNTGDQDMVTDEVLFPARAQGVIGVGATDEGDFGWEFSASGDAVDIVAPGSYEYTTVPGGGYAFTSGTSMAAARVAGGIAFLVSRLPLLTPEAIDEFLVRCGDDLGLLGHDAVFGYGMFFLPSMLRMAEIGWKM